MMAGLSDAADELAAWAERGGGKGFVLRAKDNTEDPEKVRTTMTKEFQS